LKPEQLSDFSKSIKKSLNIEEKDIFFISAATGEGIKELLNALEESVSKNKLDLI
jgi:selenocysteine-specific translation elongation factor